jgi:hypothetical protein
MKIIELVMEEDEVYGVNAISIVDTPAIGEHFVHFNDQQVKFKTIDKEKRIILGAVLVPNLPIYRKNDDGEEFYVFMSKETVRKAMERYMINGFQASTTIQHEEMVDGCTVVETWMKEGEYDKSMNFGMQLPDGTWCVAMKVENEVIWNDWVKEGKVKGFSIEAFFVDRMKIKSTEEKMLSEIEELVKPNESLL